MLHFELQPKVGAGPVLLGMTRAEVRDAVGLPESEDDQREWYLEDMAVDFDSNGKAEFIELAESENYRVTYQGECLHELDADAAIAHVSQFASFDETAPEFGYTYLFPELQLSLWRPVIPDDEQDPDDPIGRRFESVSIGGPGYFKQ